MQADHRKRHAGGKGYGKKTYSDQEVKPIRNTHGQGIARAGDEDEAVAMANDTAFGLAATVVGGDPDRAARVADRIQAGHVWVNSAQIIPPSTAWGGFGASGIGRELGPWGLSAWQGIKHITYRA